MSPVSRAGEQLVLPFRLDAHKRFELFVAGENAAALEHAADAARGERAGLVWLWGASATGKSHLLQAACRAADAAGRRAMYLPLGGAGLPAPGILAGLESLDLLAVDDVTAAGGDGGWERALFGLANACLDAGGSLVMADRRAPREARFDLPDLASRMNAAAVYRLAALDDQGLCAALQRQARDLGLEIDGVCARYLLARIDRDMVSVRAWLERLDELSLSQQRPITVPLVREMLGRREV